MSTMGSLDWWRGAVETQRDLYRRLLGREIDPEGQAVVSELQREQGWTAEQIEAWIKAGEEYARLRPPFPPPIGDGLVGQVRVIGPSFGDVIGPRQIRLCSWFPALRIARDDRDGFLRQLDAIVAAGWRGVRIFMAVGAQPYWAGREVLPSWPDYDAVGRGVLTEFRARGLKAHITAGDMQVLFPGGTGETDFQRRLGQIVRDIGSDVVALHEVWNEGWQNNAFGDDPARGAHLARTFRAECPGPLQALSAPSTNEEPDGIRRWSIDPADVVAMHGTRQDGLSAIRRAFNLRYEAVTTKPIWQGEPAGPGPDAYQRQDDPTWLFGLYLMHIMTGQASNYFSSPSIRFREPLDRYWGFRELPRLYDLLPEDVGQWPNMSHGNKSTTPLGATSFLSQGAGPERLDQVWNDRRVACLVYGGTDWTRVFARRSVRCRIVGPGGVEGDGLSRLDASQRARLILGEFT